MNTIAKPIARELPTFDAPQVFETPFPAPLGYSVVVKPRPPKKQVGRIATSKKTQEADQALETIGTVLAVGSLAWGASGGLDLTNDPSKPKVGDWVVYRQYAGQKLRLRKSYKIEDADPDGSTLSEFILVMLDTDVLARFGSLAEAEKFYAWI
jgi:co-chaperonin GroES (HSP10)